jgi:hypothetical protein
MPVKVGARVNAGVVLAVATVPESPLAVTTDALVTVPCGPLIVMAGVVVAVATVPE